MSRNGSGTYSLPAGNPVVSGTTISSTWANNTLSDIATALTASIAKDGQTVPTANLPMGSFKLTGLGAGTAAGNSLRFEQLFSQGAPTDIASAATVDIGGVSTNFLTITGTTTITSFGTNYNGPKMLKFTGALLLTYNATTLVLPTAANITTAAGDTCIAIPKSTASGTSDGWQIIAYQRASGLPLAGITDYLNTTRIDVASATTTDLTANAPNTRNINITGTTTITGFTVAIGQLYFVRFNAALTLTNNAAIVTQTGANITTAAGDTCIIRATAANTVEVLSYVPGAGVTGLVNATGRVIQIVEATPYTTYTAHPAATSAIPWDDTIPQNTEGLQILSVAITPKSTTNRLRIEWDFMGAASTSAGHITVALFQDSTANALAVRSSGGDSAQIYSLYGSYEMAAGTTSSTTFKLNFGVDTGTAYVNGNSSGRRFGSASAARLRVTEIAV